LEARRKVYLRVVLEFLVVAFLVLGGILGEIVIFGLIVARPFGDVCIWLIGVSAMNLWLEFRIERHTLSGWFAISRQDILESFALFEVAGGGTLLNVLWFGRHISGYFLITPFYLKL